MNACNFIREECLESLARIAYIIQNTGTVSPEKRGIDSNVDFVSHHLAKSNELGHNKRAMYIAFRIFKS